MGINRNFGIFFLLSSLMTTNAVLAIRATSHLSVELEGSTKQI